jgi:two-component sensor histidine kinase
MLIVMLTSTVALILACTAFITYEMIMFRQSMVQGLSVLAEIIGSNSTAALVFDDRITAEEILSALRAEKHVVSACIYNKNGSVFADYVRDPIKVDFPKKIETRRYRFSNNHLILFQPIVLDTEVVGYIYLQTDLKEIVARLKRYASIIASVFLISIFAAFIISSFLQRVISKPIMHLVDIAKTVTMKKDYSIRAVKNSQDELGLLIDGFNDMLSQIQERDLALNRNQEELEMRVEERTKELMLEIVERKYAEAQIKESLQEKEMLLREIHHRVKNNLQVISSLLYLQSKNVTTKKALEMFGESRNRVKTMALIHEKLYQSNDLSKIDFADYIQSLSYQLFHSYGLHSDKATIQVDVDKTPLDIDKAIHCGLIINELVSNSLKYAFPNGKKGKISVRLYNEIGNKVILIVSDNGVGMPKDMDLKKTKTLGLQLVDALVHQLGGKIELSFEGGTTFKIDFSA